MNRSDRVVANEKYHKWSVILLNSFESCSAVRLCNHWPHPLQVWVGFALGGHFIGSTHRVSLLTILPIYAHSWRILEEKEQSAVLCRPVCTSVCGHCPDKGEQKNATLRRLNSNTLGLSQGRRRSAKCKFLLINHLLQHTFCLCMYFLRLSPLHNNWWGVNDDQRWPNKAYTKLAS